MVVLHPSSFPVATNMNIKVRCKSRLPSSESLQSAGALTKPSKTVYLYGTKTTILTPKKEHKGSLNLVHKKALANNERVGKHAWRHRDVGKSVAHSILKQLSMSPL